MKMFQKMFIPLGGLLVAALASFACLAASSVEINRRTYTCQNKCVITYTSTGRMQVSDSEGGWVVVKTDGAPVDALP